VTESWFAARVAADAARVAAEALAEDGPADVTAAVTIAEGQQGRARIEARAPLVFAGARYAEAVVAAVGLPPIAWQVTDGAGFDSPAVLGHLTGSLAAILRAERPLLNLLQRGSGIATLTARCVALAQGTACRILHTRKTTPGLRTFEVAAVLAGGGALHRLDLASAVMVKDNHWQALAASGRTLADALARARATGVTQLQVEVESVAQLEAACDAGATRVLIDNQPVHVVADWVTRARQRSPGIEVEATGGIDLDTLAAYAATGVDYISTGMLTHSVPSADLGLEITD
jgi:nicotinate-nucleotide pyrophosphorylase (carboxylating)